MSQLAVGTQAPDFELKDAAGRSHRLRDALARGPVVLAFYKSECPTCQFTFPYIQKIFDRVRNNAPWTLWAISQDDAGETRSFARQYRLTFDVLIDEYPYPISTAYGLQFVPGIFIVQQDGTIAVSEFGFSKLALNRIAGFEYFSPNDGLPATRPG